MLNSKKAIFRNYRQGCPGELKKIFTAGAPRKEKLGFWVFSPGAPQIGKMGFWIFHFLGRLREKSQKIPFFGFFIRGAAERAHTDLPKMGF
jgi:hypothetical protein